MPEELAKDDSEKRIAEFKDMISKAANESDRDLVITAAAILDFYRERVIKSFIIDVNEVRELHRSGIWPVR